MKKTFQRAKSIYQISFKKNDYLWAKYVSRPPAALLLAMLEDVPVTPHQLTLFGLLVSFISCLLFAFRPDKTGLIVGWLCLQLAFIIDCMDGMLARYKNKGSPEGQKFDFLADELKTYMTFAAVVWRLYAASGQTLTLALGMVGVAFMAAGFATTHFMRSPEYTGLTHHGQRAFRTGIVGRLEHAASALMHYPSWIWIPVFLDRMDLFFWINALIYTAYFLYAFCRVAFKLGRRSRFNA